MRMPCLTTRFERCLVECGLTTGYCCGGISRATSCVCSCVVVGCPSTPMRDHTLVRHQQPLDRRSQSCTIIKPSPHFNTSDGCVPEPPGASSRNLLYVLPTNTNFSAAQNGSVAETVARQRLRLAMTTTPLRCNWVIIVSCCRREQPSNARTLASSSQRC